MHQSRLLGPWPSFAMSCVTLSKLSGLSDLRLLFSYNRESDRTNQGSRPDAVGGSGTTLIIMRQVPALSVIDLWYLHIRGMNPVR